MPDDTQRELGKHGAEIEALQTNMTKLQGDVEKILSILAEARGGWKTLMLVAGVAGAVGAGLGKLAMVIGWLPK